jgi:hypothetical protein
MELTDNYWRSCHSTATCMLSARVPISRHCKSLAYYNGLTRVHRRRRLNKTRVHS